MWLCLVFFIISCLRGSTGQSVKQTSGILTVTEEELVSLSCSYEGEYNVNYPFWYIQHPGQPLKILLDTTDNNAQGFEATHHKNGKKGTFDMQKPAIQLEDSAVYFCAFREDISKIIFGSGTRLIIMPKLDNSEPSVYQLKSKNEESNVAACLITDYSPNPINVKSEKNSEPVPTSGSVVVVKDGNNKESASLGVVKWGKNDDQFHCSATYNGIPYEAENQGDETCSENTLSGTPAFETDERLNLLSLTVLGLRMIFFKSVALNLILTYWAWSR